MHGRGLWLRPLTVAILFSTPLCAQADNAETANKSNNPLNLAPGLNFQDYYTPSLYDTNAHTNDLLVRGTLPIAPGASLVYRNCCAPRCPSVPARNRTAATARAWAT